MGSPTAIAPIPAASSVCGDGMSALSAGGSNGTVANGNGCGYGQDGYGPSTPYRGILNRSEPSPCGSYANGNEFDGFNCEGCGCCPWYVGANALIMSRNEGRRLWTSYDATNEANQFTNTQDIGLAWQAGGEITIGRRFCWCDATWAVEATYWTTEAFTGSVCTTNPVPGNLVSTPLRVWEIQFNGYPGTDWFDNAKEQQLSRRDEFQNVEVNLVRQQVACCCDSPWDIGWTIGFRYFRFQENLTYGSLQAGCNWGQQGGICEAYLNDTVTNNLFGCQFGVEMGYCVCNNFRLFFCPKFGIYDDQMNQDFRATWATALRPPPAPAAWPARTPFSPPATRSRSSHRSTWAPIGRSRVA